MVGHLIGIKAQLFEFAARIMLVQYLRFVAAGVRGCPTNPLLTFYEAIPIPFLQRQSPVFCTMPYWWWDVLGLIDFDCGIDATRSLYLSGP